jgi:hypothetical protein
MPDAQPLQPLFRRIDAIVARWHGLVERAFDSYQPERHYMRGPGPKWRAKHGIASHAV